ncbi:MAG: hypothetical protein QOK43_3014 [Acidimicrobiaceae bacterium]|nr:hypothetical protein [Acidimicrobiaceae bacterium]
MAREGVRVRDDERGAFERLFHEHYDAVLAYALLRADVELAKDAAAQTFLVAWRRRDDMPEQVRPWLLGVTRRTLADMRRSATRRRSLVARVSTMGRAGGAAAAATAAHVDPADAVAEADGVVNAFLTLSESDREVLRLVAWDRLPAADAAVVLGCSEAAFAVRLSRARRRLAAAFEVHDSVVDESEAEPEVEADPLDRLPEPLEAP